jgi:hypothetical protein
MGSDINTSLADRKTVGLPCPVFESTNEQDYSNMCLTINEFFRDIHSKVPNAVSVSCARSPRSMSNTGPIPTVFSWMTLTFILESCTIECTRDTNPLSFRAWDPPLRHQNPYTMRRISAGDAFDRLLAGTVREPMPSGICLKKLLV